MADASEEQTPAKWCIMRFFFIVAHMVFSFGRGSGVTYVTGHLR